MANKIVLVKMLIDFGRMGELDGMFVCDEEQLARLYEREVCFGEALGKHSEVTAVLEPAHFEVKSDDLVFIKKLVEVLGVDLNGHNPFDHMYDDKYRQLSEESEAFLYKAAEVQDVL